MKRLVKTGLAAAMLLTLTSNLIAQPAGPASSSELSAPMQLFAPAVELYRPASPPLRLAAKAGLPALAELASAHQVAAEKLAEISAWNLRFQLPSKNGFTRPLEVVRKVRLGPSFAGKAGGYEAHDGGLVAKSATGALVWGAEVRIADAHRVRLQLADVDLPAGTRIWVYGPEGETVGPFGLELKAPDGTLWTPSIGGGRIRIEVEAPAGAVTATSGFEVRQVAEMFALDGQGRALSGLSLAPKNHIVSCLEDVRCHGPGTFDFINPARSAIAHLQYVVGSNTFICTGGLLNDTNQASVIPYMQTANHCIGNQAEASSLEAFWDYFAPSCNAPWPALGSLPRSSGGTLLATGAIPAPDVTLLRLHSIPNNRTLLGWNGSPSAVGAGTTLHRISHPLGAAQAYSRSTITATAPACFPLIGSSFLYQTANLGGTFGGSSGAPAMLAGGFSVGQLLGACGPDPIEGCDYRNAVVDGSFAESFPALAPFLLDLGFPPCVPDNDTLCLNNGRFRAELEWANQNGASGVGRVAPAASNDSGLFYFTNPNNWEMLVKVNKACVNPFNHYWVFYAATTNVEFTLTVTDTQAGQVRLYGNSLRQAAPPIQDTAAFATCP